MSEQLNPKSLSEPHDIGNEPDMTDLMIFAQWGNNFTLRLGQNFIDGIHTVTNKAYPMVSEQSEVDKSL